MLANTYKYIYLPTKAANWTPHCTTDVKMSMTGSISSFFWVVPFLLIAFLYFSLYGTQGHVNNSKVLSWSTTTTETYSGWNKTPKITTADVLLSLRSAFQNDQWRFGLWFKVAFWQKKPKCYKSLSYKNKLIWHISKGPFTTKRRHSLYPGTWSHIRILQLLNEMHVKVEILQHGRKYYTVCKKGGFQRKKLYP